jgi:wyosine [tRNA(Phe)-imidazoG37] synthetase (radical SAM superfamily)
MKVLPLRSGIIYGPVNSRRLGRSLGINILPTGSKLCSFDCIYCHYGRTHGKTASAPQEAFPDVAAVLGAVEDALKAHRDIDYLTFSGNGEATLHPAFGEIVDGVRSLRDRLSPGVRIAILSNATTVTRPEVRAALARIDLPILKLDAGDRKTMAGVNRPADGVVLDEIVEGLHALPGVTIQTVFIDGRVANSSGEAFETWIAALSRIRPARVQIYSTDRPVAEAGVERVPPYALRALAEEVERRVGVPVEAFWVDESERDR